MKDFIDLRSDTVTIPTEEMREAMAKAPVGDDVYGEDPTVNRLEEIAAARVAKEAALFLPSGTMGNQVAVLTHCGRGEEVIMEAQAHVFYYEVAGLAVLAGVQTRPIPGNDGKLSSQQVEEAIRPIDLHVPRTSLICLENTHNRAGGIVSTPEEIAALRKAANKYQIPIHLDGARIFNAAVALKRDVKDLVADVDSVMFCLSKGLASPVGSILAGTKDFIERAKKMRKLLGGGMRQAGILAAAGIISLEKMVERLEIDHQNAKLLAESLNGVGGIKINLSRVQTNIVLLDLTETKFDAPTLLLKLAEQNVRASQFSPYTVRLVTHKDINSDDVEETIKRIKLIMKFFFSIKSPYFFHKSFILLG